MKKRLFIILLALYSMVFTSPIYAEEPQYEWIILDELDLLTPEQEASLVIEHIKPLLEYGNVIFSTVDLSTSNYEKVAEDTYYQYFKNEPGVHFQIDMGNRKLTLSASTEMEKRIGRERDSIVDNIYKLATNQDYYSCAAKCFDQITIVLNDGKIAHTMKYIDNGILALTLGLIINFIFVFWAGSRKTSNKKLVTSSIGPAVIVGAAIRKGRVVKEYSPQSSGGGSHGGFSGGGGGGGFSGGSSSHGF